MGQAKTKVKRNNNQVNSEPAEPPPGEITHSENKIINIKNSILFDMENDIVQKVISYLGEKKKLKMVKYNKNLQNKLDIKLTHYKMYSGKYIIYEENGRGKEYNYDYDILLYEGEFLNGKRNGIGKEYALKIIFYEGEFLNGYRNGRGKMYDFNQKLIFEGEFKGGLMWSGKGYDGHYNIIYELQNGNGIVRDYYKDKLVSEIEYKNGKKNGRGKEYDDGNLIFEGEKWKKMEW